MRGLNEQFESMKALTLRVALLFYLCTSLAGVAALRVGRPSRLSKKTLRRLMLTTAQIAEKLTGLSKESSECLLTNGINKKTFEQCFGKGYAKLSVKYLDFYHELSGSVLQELRANLADMCAEANANCEAFYQIVSEKMAENKNASADLRLAAKEMENVSTFPAREYRVAINELVRSYIQFLNARMDITKKLNDAIKKVQVYISKTGIKTDFDYLSIDRSAALDQLELGVVDIESINEDDNEEEGDCEEEAEEDDPTIAYIGIDENGNSVASLDLENESLNSQIKTFTFQEEKRERRPSKENLEMRKKLVVNKNRFFQSLIKEHDPLKLLQFYLGSGRVDPKGLDLSDLPSVQVRKIKEKEMAVG